ncbi:biopolymer transporter ExbD [Telmatospirillum sp.]|uniref:ExbD/TolR family protein n=1 Tax=Telmatospirillum sp. TaxID=2079197 RepID=UPI00283CDFA8|nr:biopolymer transporter ExbD [Telmatospirillum sp.]MDR3436871.1 biopolymer transporter ExbD [Telmatospirillum sp.]
MRRWDDASQPKARIEIIPMIDVMMFLLVFFVLISQNVIPALGVKTKLPEASQSDDLRSATKRAVVTIAADGLLQLEGKQVTLAELPARLKLMQQDAQGRLVIVINGDEASTLQQLIGVMDTLKGHGFEALSIATKKKLG